jgi:hypothetical protein
MPIHKELLPHGYYEATVTGRGAFGSQGAGSDDTGIELGVTITKGPFANQPLTFKVWGQTKTRRAKSFKRGQVLRIYVIQHQLDDGRRVNRIVDFHAAASMTVIEAMSDGNLPTGESSRLDIATKEQTEIPAVLWRRLRDAAQRRPTGEQVSNSSAADFLVAALTAGREEWASKYRWGFHRSGGKSGTREIVEHEEQLHAYGDGSTAAVMQCDAYLSHFQYAEDLNTHQQASEKRSLAGYRGGAWSRRLTFDLDGDGTDAGLERALRDAYQLVDLLQAVGVPTYQILVFFSGRKGVHILFPSGCFGAGPKQGFEQAVEKACQLLAKVFDVTIDVNIYKPLASLRAPNTRHDESGLFKVLLPAKDLATLTAKDVQSLAKEPRPFVMPDWRTPPVPLLVDLWSWACAAGGVECRRAARVAQGERRIFADTLDLMMHGAPEGERGTRFFKAAMNLLDYDCPEELLVALLEPAARFSDYPIDQFRTQLEGALKALDARNSAAR